jgi:hypothetical protein
MHGISHNNKQDAYALTRIPDAITRRGGAAPDHKNPVMLTTIQTEDRVPLPTIMRKSKK